MSNTLMFVTSFLLLCIYCNTTIVGDNSKLPKWYKMYSQLPSPSPFVEPSIIMEPNYVPTSMAINTSFNSEDLNEDFSSFTSGFDMRYVPANETSMFNSTAYVEKNIELTSIREQDQMTRIIMYHRMQDLLMILLSPAISVHEKIIKIKNFPQMDKLTDDSLFTDICAGDILEDWEFKINDD